MHTDFKVVQAGAKCIRSMDPTVKIDFADKIRDQTTEDKTVKPSNAIERFIKDRSPHRDTSPLEHVWITIHSDPPFDFDLRILIDVYSRINRLLSYTPTECIGNLRMFHDMIIDYTQPVEGRDYWTTSEFAIYIIGNELRLSYPKIFNEIRYAKSPEMTYDKHNEKITIKEYDKYKSIHMITSRNVANELVKHRTLSWSVEQPDLCDYTKIGLKFIIPDVFEWANDRHLEDDKVYESIMYQVRQYLDDSKIGAPVYMDINREICTGYSYRPANIGQLIENEKSAVCLYLMNCQLNADTYVQAITGELMSIQDASMLLSGSLRTELLVTATDEQWKKFIESRFDTANENPQITESVELLKLTFEGSLLDKEIESGQEKMRELLTGKPN